MILTATIICREALVVFLRLREASPTLDELYAAYEAYEPWSGQMRVDICFDKRDLERSLDDFSEKFILPAMLTLAKEIPRDLRLSSEMFAIPSGFEMSAAERWGGVAMRAVADRVADGTPLCQKEMIMRFDVRSEANAA